MALEQITEHSWQFVPGPFDVHAHPRVFDAVTSDNFITLNNGQEGKAGLKIYTEAALRAGITGIAAMPNESVRLYDDTDPEKTEEIPYPIASLDRVRAMQAAISHEAVIPTAVYMGLDPSKVFWDLDKQRLKTELLEVEFQRVQDECLGLKVYLAETTGGNNIAVEHGAQVASIWHHYNPEKPIIFHVEGEDVAQLFRDIYHLPVGQDIPVHIAHVSSRQELEAVMAAKESGMNVTCEVTPHHLFLDETVRQEIGGYGCMKPSLKPQEDVDFLWANMRYIDMFASDCAPHRISDKEKDPAAFGVTNHTVMLPLLFGAVETGQLGMEDIYQKFCIAPRQRFNLALDDQSLVRVNLAREVSAALLEERISPHYGQNLFTKLGRAVLMKGQVVEARAGQSMLGAPRASYTHLIRPKNFRR